MDPIPLVAEFKDFLRLLIENRVEFLLVGGYAVNYHGYIRGTVDFDVWVRFSSENSAKLEKALLGFGVGQDNIPSPALDKPGRMLRMGYPPYRIEILTHIDGVEYDGCEKRAVRGELDGILLPIISLPDLITNKKASGRHKDLADVEQLERML